jgi:hypothetical protein
LIEQAIQAAKHNKTVVNLDWVQYYGELESFDLLSGSTQVYENVVCLKQEQPVSGWRISYEILVDGESFGWLYTDNRIESCSERSASLKVNNNLLYTDYWYDLFAHVCHSIHYKPKNITRLDIALDGTQHVRNFLNGYIKQSQKNRTIFKSGKARLSSYWNDPDTLDFERFTIGSSKSNKVVSVYNKTKELE